MEEALESIFVQVQGQNFPLVELQDVPYEDLFREYSVYLPNDFLPANKTQTEITTKFVNTNPELPLVFKPASRVITVFYEAPHKANDASFKVVKGMFVTGKTEPRVSDARVSI